MNKSILITGGNGLIGKALTKLLLRKGYIVNHLSRSGRQEIPNVKTFKWDVYGGSIDENCIDGVDVIVHLAGEGIADKRWTKKRKEQIIKSRTVSIAMLYDLLSKKQNHVRALISASGMNYYAGHEDKLQTEESPAGDGFLSGVCVKWENAADEGEKLGLRIVKLRTGIVLDKHEGALAKIALPISYGLGAVLGSGKQWVSWIHLEDAVRIYLFAIENNIEGVYNMSAPQTVTNQELTQAIGKEMKRPLWLPNIPVFTLKLILGEMSSTVLESIKASSDKIQSEGFEFNFPALQEALKDLKL